MKLRYHLAICALLWAARCVSAFFVPYLIREHDSGLFVMFWWAVLSAPIGYSAYLLFRIHGIFNKIGFAIVVITTFIIVKAMNNPIRLYIDRYVLPLQSDDMFLTYVEHTRKHYIDTYPVGTAYPIVIDGFHIGDVSSSHSQCNTLFGRNRNIVVGIESGKDWRCFSFLTRLSLFEMSLNIFDYGMDKCESDLVAKRGVWICDTALFLFGRLHGDIEVPLTQKEEVGVSPD